MAAVHRPRQFASYLSQRVGVQTLLVLGIVVVGFLLTGRAFVRWDLTEDRRFTISQASKALVQELTDPLTIRAYFSSNLPPRYEPLQRQVFDVLAEYEAASDGKLKWERHDPQTSRTAESEAKNYGLAHVELPVYEASSMQILKVYGGLVMLYRDRASEVVNVAQRYPEDFEGLSILEYEISSRIYQLINDRPTLGIVGYLQSQPQANPFAPGGAPRAEFQGLRRLLGEAFTIEDVDLKTNEPDPAKIPLLLVVRPKEFSDVEVFRLDQYLMKGGRVLMFITQGTLEQSPFEQSLRYQQFKTGLDEWLQHHGVRVPNEFVCHFQNSERQTYITAQGELRIQPLVFLPFFWDELMDRDNPAVNTLKKVTLLWAHPIDILRDRLQGKKATVLVHSNAAESWRWRDLARIDPGGVTRSDLPRSGETLESAVAVSLEGIFTSYFAERPAPPSLTPKQAKEEGGEKAGDGETIPEAPAPEEGEEGEAAEGKEEAAGDGGKIEEAPKEEEKQGEAEKPGGASDGAKKEEAPKGPEVVQQSREATLLVVIGNSLFISDQVLGGDKADDRAKQATLLALNLVDWLTRSKDLIAMRAKKYNSRALIDKDFQTQMEAASKKLEEGKISESQFSEEWDVARERQEIGRKRWRWLNILVPCAAVLLAGATAWSLRAAMRA
ncbi:MAG: Gldg family protein, partial [Planctomycetota bacterium]